MTPSGPDPSAPCDAPPTPGGHLDALIVIPPPSPSNTNPPLGPAVLATVAARHGLRVDVLDLNAHVLKRFSSHTLASGQTLGDHGKDRSVVATAAAWVFDNTGLRARRPLHLPDAADAVAGMHYSLPDISQAVATAIQQPEPWRPWLQRELHAACNQPPAVVGVSLMGPSQVFVGLLVLALVREIWPATTTVLGGSHVTLLADDLRSDGRCRDVADVILSGHCEDEFAALVSRLARRANGRIAVSPAPARADAPFEYFPSFSESQLSLYDRDLLTFPVQFTRGCSYGRCTFCTYPVVEPQVTKLAPMAARRTIEALVHLHGVRRYSLKDSLFTAPMLRSFAEALMTEPVVPIRWSATTKANRALIPMAPFLAESGLATVELGVETISQVGQQTFDKRADPTMVQDLVLALAEHGVTVVVNLIFGYPGERLQDAQAQLDWLARLGQAAPIGRVDCSLNMLEMVRGSPMIDRPPDGVELIGVAPWAFSYAWNAPPWRKEFSSVLKRTELAQQIKPFLVIARRAV
jgi:hypothetical protein